MPSWIKPADTPANYLSGVQIGVGIAQANQRLAAQREQAAIEAEVQTRRIQAQMEESRQRLAIQQAYHDQVLALRQGELEDAAAKNAMGMRVMASKLAAQQSYRERVAAGEDPSKVMLELGPAMGAAAGDVGAAMRVSRGPQKPTWIPADPASGAPGHFETPSGAVHIPPRVTPASNTALINSTVSELKARRKLIIDSMSPIEPVDPKRKQVWSKQQKDLADINQRIESLLPGVRALQGEAPAGTVRRVVRKGNKLVFEDAQAPVTPPSMDPGWPPTEEEEME